MRCRSLPTRSRRAAARAAGGLFFASVVAAAPGLAHGVEPNIYIAPSAWFAELAGSGRTGVGSPAEDFDLENTTGLDTTETSRSFEGFLRFGPNKIIFGRNHSDYAGSTQLDGTLVFRDLSYPPGTHVHSELDYDRWRLIYSRPFVDRRTVAGGFLLGFESYEIDLGLKAPGVGKPHARLDSTAPLLGVSVTYQPAHAIRIYAEATGMSMERGGVDTRIFQAYAVVEYLITTEFVAASAGYRYLSLLSDENDEARFNFTQRGFSTGLVFRF